MPNLLHLLYYRLGMGDKPPFLEVDKLMFTKLNSGTGASLCSLNLTKLLLLGLLYWPFAYAQGIQSDLKVGLHIMMMLIMVNSFYSMMTYGTDRRGSVPPYSIARQFYSPRPPTHASLRSAWGRPGRIGSLITWVWQGGLVQN